jgi:CBS domain-containing protein
MLVKDLMCNEPATCSTNVTLADVAKILWEKDCGIVPVVDAATFVLSGVITDRDVCMAAFFRDRRLAELGVTEFIQRPALTCRENDSLDAALSLMRDRQVHRLPVVDKDQHVVGMISVKDIAAFATTSHATLGLREQVLRTLVHICEPRNGGRRANGGAAAAKSSGEKESTATSGRR